jgi:hypothetical protein
MPDGSAWNCRRKPNANTPPVTNSTEPITPGATNSPRGRRHMANTWRGAFPHTRIWPGRLRAYLAGHRLPAEPLRPL